MIKALDLAYRKWTGYLAAKLKAQQLYSDDTVTARYIRKREEGATTSNTKKILNTKRLSRRIAMVLSSPRHSSMCRTIPQESDIFCIDDFPGLNDDMIEFTRLSDMWTGFSYVVKDEREIRPPHPQLKRYSYEPYRVAVAHNPFLHMYEHTVLYQVLLICGFIAYRGRAPVTVLQFLSGRKYESSMRVAIMTRMGYSTKSS